MKRFLCCVLALWLVVGVLVAPTTASMEDYTFTLTVNGTAQARMDLGDTVTVQLRIRSNHADEIRLYGMQDYINFDPAYLQFVPDSEKFYEEDGYPLISGSILPGGRQVFTNRAGMSPLVMKNGTLLMQFDLKAVKPGTVSIESSGAEMIDQNIKTYSVGYENASVTIGLYSALLPDGTVKQVTCGTDLRITPEAASAVTGVRFRLASGVEKAAEKNSDGTYTIPGAEIVDDMTITYEYPEGLDSSAFWELIPGSRYLALPANTFGLRGDGVAVLHTAKKPWGTFRLSDRGDLFWSEKYGGYVTVTGPGETAASLSAKLTSVGAPAVSIGYRGDVNGDGRVTSADSAVISAALFQVPDRTYEVGPQMYLEMDTDGDRAVSTADIMNILRRTVGSSPAKSVRISNCEE